MQRFGAIAAAVHGFGELIDLDARTTENDRRCRGFDVENATERRRLVRTLHHVRRLTNEGGLARPCIAEPDLDLERIA